MVNASHHGTRVSKSHAAMLHAYEVESGTTLTVNQGRRTLAEQAGFYAIYLRNGRPLAAKPFPGAPHIKWGKEHHALDINDGIVDKVAAFYRRHGVPVAFNVTGEAWHMDTLDEAKLKAAAAKVGAVGPSLKYGNSGPSVLKLKRMLYAKGIRNFSGKTNSSRFVPFFGKYTKEAVQRFQKAHGLKADGIVGSTTWRALSK